jgi:eukaryotic-like serine/threonine-protein kinase
MSSSSHLPNELRLPLTLPDRYQVKRHLANGGMASVWCADDLELDRSVAIKVLAERFAHDAEALRRFKREARAAARVGTHPQVVSVYDVDVTPADADGPGRAFIVMEYLAGGTVADAIRHDDIRRQEAIRWLREAASALDYAHAAGIVHRDIKPANFLLDRSRVLHVADFGIARLTSEETITSPDQLFGTAAYLSPEQALGHEATSASDRYALAVVAFELLVGERPFHSPHFSAQARQHIESPPPAASERNRLIPPAVDPVLAAGLAKDPQQRPASADAFVRALETAFGERRPARRQFPTRRVAGPGMGAPDALTEAARGGRGRLTRSRSVAAVAERPGPRQPAPTWAPSSPPPGGRAPRRRRRLGALASLLAVFVIIGVAAAAAAGVFSGSSGNRTGDALAAGRSAQQARGSLGHASSAATAQAAFNATPSAAELALTGHRQMLDGNYPEALQTLKQAVSTADRSSTTYASALYDLGRTMLLSGDPQAAIPVLRERLTIPVETTAVRATLNAALQAAGPPAFPATSAPTTTSSTTSSPTTSSTTTTPTNPTGGAGVAGPGLGGGPGTGGGNGGDAGGPGPGGGAGGGPGSTGGGSGSTGGGSGSAGGGSGSGSGGNGPGNGPGGNGGNGPGSGAGGNGAGNGPGSGSGGNGSGGSGSGGAGLTGQLAASA